MAARFVLEKGLTGNNGATWDLSEGRLRRKRILGDVVKGGEDLGSEESERQRPEPQRGRVELPVGQPGDAVAGLGSHP